MTIIQEKWGNTEKRNSKGGSSTSIERLNLRCQQDSRGDTSDA